MLVPKYFVSNKILGPQNFGSKKILGPKKIGVREYNLFLTGCPKKRLKFSHILGKKLQLFTFQMVLEENKETLEE